MRELKKKRNGQRERDRGRESYARKKNYRKTKRQIYRCLILFPQASALHQFENHQNEIF